MEVVCFYLYSCLKLEQLSEKLWLSFGCNQEKVIISHSHIYPLYYTGRKRSLNVSLKKTGIKFRQFIVADYFFVRYGLKHSQPRISSLKLKK